MNYAAIKLTRDTVLSALANVADIPAGRDRLIWAMLKYPVTDEELYYIGGNYLRTNQPDFARQILTQTQLDELFHYTPRPKKKNGRPDPDQNWFLVKLKSEKEVA